ncbi:uncharacterized protein LOC126743222 [Anthonomus grandis grandis]|uniref:uncharacterized protein LOC126743222 n=1 Tax=Anthonomus grandis grandis TaxID=2921223 RepID=UPI002164F568|nr:uncharacterized protein LOC126743222 [Anthonomus grandis grandis]XP_050306169.1 uncharacterized protein LOC126743222 [Anthonomus grandis grandis]XP_050306170.1 uncharacterized protein LOC126743222 [Anthonomus grandis grandis]
MWIHQLLLITLVQVFYVSTRSVEPIDEPIWLNRLTNIIDDLEDQPKQETNRDSDDLPFYEISDEKDTTDDDEEQKTYPASDKRALSMFARWGTLNAIGKERNPIRSGLSSKNLDSISTQTRSRILGQPLRWG